jgi:hypothetical protein
MEKRRKRERKRKGRKKENTGVQSALPTPDILLPLPTPPKGNRTEIQECRDWAGSLLVEKLSATPRLAFTCPKATGERRGGGGSFQIQPHPLRALDICQPLEEPMTFEAREGAWSRDARADGNGEFSTYPRRRFLG